MKTINEITHQIHESERQLLTRLRATRRAGRATPAPAELVKPLTLGQRVADKVAATMGSWTFIILQSMRSLQNFPEPATLRMAFRFVQQVALSPFTGMFREPETFQAPLQRRFEFRGY